MLEAARIKYRTAADNKIFTFIVKIINELLPI